MRTNAIYNLIPAGFKCPICLRSKAGVHQWVITNIGELVCRDCLALNPTWHADALLSDAELFELANKAYVRMRYAHDYECGIIQRYYSTDNKISSQSLCARCGVHTNMRTRRVAGYCSKCRYNMLVVVHGGAGAFREDKYGRRFVTLPTRQAKYTWGNERLPLHSTIESDVIKWKAQAAYMWEYITDNYQACISIAESIVRPPMSVDDVSDLIPVAIGKGLLSFDMSQERDIEKYVQSCVRNAVEGYAKNEQRRMYREVAVSQLDREKSKSIELLFKEYNFSKPKAIQTVLELGIEEADFNLLRKWVIENKTMEQIGVEYGVTKATVSKWIKNIHAKYRERAEQALEDLRDTDFIESTLE
jgi:hypothetical protein